MGKPKIIADVEEVETKIGDLSVQGIIEPDLATAIKNDRIQITNIPNQTYITEKAKQSDLNTINITVDKLQTQVSSLSNGSPKGTFATLSALQSDSTANTTDGKKNIYVVTADGNWYYWNGTAWVSGGVYQSTGIADDSVTEKKLSFIPVKGKMSKNLFDKNAITPNTYVSYSAGYTVYNTNYCLSDYIPVKSSTAYSQKGSSEQYAWFDSSKTYISGGTYFGANIISPSNAGYLRLSMLNSQVDSVQFEEGATQTSYIHYGSVFDESQIQNPISIDKLDSILTPITIVTKIIAQDGTGDYISPKLANDAIIDANEKKVYNLIIYPGIYTEVGWTLKNYVNLIGISKENCWLKGELPNSSTDNDIENTSTINVNSNNNIENLKITCKNMRYAVHDESSGAIKDWNKNIRNCYIEHLGNDGAVTWRNVNTSSGLSPSNVWVSQCAYGSGVSSNSTLILEDCTLKAPFPPFSVHNNAYYSKPCKVILERCQIINTGINNDYSIRVQSLGSGTDDKVIVKGCQLNAGILHNDYPWLGNANATTHKNFEVRGSDNSKVSYTSNFTTNEIDRPNFLNEYNNFIASTGISKGQAVCFANDYKHIKVMTSSDDISLFAGFMMEDTISGNVGKVKINGYIAKSDLYNFSENITFGNKYGVGTDGSLIINSNAIVIGVDDNNIKIIKENQ